MKTESLIKKKRAALQYFINQLINTKAKEHIGKIFLFGSLSKGRIKEDSDIDLLVFCTSKTDLVFEECLDLQLDTYSKHLESVEPLVYPVEMMKSPDSYFFYRVAKYGEEVYGMDEDRLKIQEAKNYLSLAEEYLEGAKENISAKRDRIAIDTGYNAAELAVKALLLLEMNDIPSSHGGVVGEFGRLYVKKEKVAREFGRGLNKALALRNKARYVYDVQLSVAEATEVIEVATKIIRLADEVISANNPRV